MHKQDHRRTSPATIHTAERRAFVMKLRLGGTTFAQIAEAAKQQFGIERLPKNYDSSQACQDVMRELDRMEKIRTDMRWQVMSIELQRLDRMLLAIWNDILKGHLGAIDRGLKIEEFRAKLLGLAQPLKIAPTTPDGEALLLNVPEFVKLLEQADKVLKSAADSDSA